MHAGDLWLEQHGLDVHDIPPRLTKARPEGRALVTAPMDSIPWLSSVDSTRTMSEGGGAGDEGYGERSDSLMWSVRLAQRNPKGTVILESSNR